MGEYFGDTFCCVDFLQDPGSCTTLAFRRFVSPLREVYAHSQKLRRKEDSIKVQAIRLSVPWVAAAFATR
jgi:hypothetical protein